MSQLQYITANEAAEKWNISRRRVLTLCKEDRIPGVAMLGNMWIIPRNAKKPVDGRTTSNETIHGAKPFLKWAGGKGQLLPELRKYYPDELGKTIKKYCEPMVGAGAVFFDVINKYDFDEVLISDTNSNLINTYEEIKNNVDDVIHVLSKMESDYLILDEEKRKEFYYERRNEFNIEIEKPTNKNATMRAALFIYLNRTCFNGLYRVNKQGKFNVPMGSYKNPTICDTENLIFVSKKLQNVNMRVADYKDIDDFVDKNTFVYFDPPYRPLTKTAGFTEYIEGGFNDEQQIELGNYIDKLAKDGVKVMASNSDPKNVNEDDNFFDDLYRRLNIYRVAASRSINSKGKGRGKINELLICGY